MELDGNQVLTLTLHGMCWVRLGLSSICITYSNQDRASHRVAHFNSPETKHMELKSPGS